MPVPSYLTELREREVQQALQLLHFLPSLTAPDLPEEETCPICLAPYSTILEEHAAATNARTAPTEREAGPSSREATGVVRLSGCGHIFCRKDLAEWVESQHGSCPACRQTFFEFIPIDEAEYESSDGGEYVPDEDEDDGLTDDGDLELIPTSDFEGYTDIDDEAEEEEDRISVCEDFHEAHYDLDPAGALGGQEEHSGNPSDVSDGVHLVGCNDSGCLAQSGCYDDGIQDDEEVEEYVTGVHSDDLEGPYYGSEELSSDGISCSTEDADVYAADISMAAEDVSSGDEESRVAECLDIKSPGQYSEGFTHTNVHCTQ